MENSAENLSSEEYGIIDGKKYKKIDSGYTIREYYSHHTPEKGPGPGWDFKEQLLDKDYALKRFGREFSAKEVFDSQLLPNDPYYIWEKVKED